MDALGLAAPSSRPACVGLDDAVITDRQRLRTYECDGLAHYKVDARRWSCCRRPPAQVAAVVRACAPRPACRSSPAAPAPGCPAARCRTPTACSSSPRGCAASCEIDRDDQRAVVEPGVINLQVTRAAAAARLLLRARPVQPAGLLDRRQRRGELRRRALPEVRLHHQPRHRRRVRHPRWRRGPSSAARRPTRRLRPARRVRRLRGHARHRHRGDRAADPAHPSRCAPCWPASTAPTRPGRRSRRSSPPA